MWLQIKRSIFISLILLCYAFSCKTAEQIEQEQKVARLDTEMKTSLQTNAQLVNRIKELEQQLGNVTGTFEEQDYEKRKLIFSQMRKLESKILVLEETNTNLTQELDKLKKAQASQKKFIDKVLKSLKSMGAKTTKTSTKKKNKKLSPYEQAVSDYKRGRYTKAKTAFSSLVPKLKGNQKARALHNLGMIAYMKKNYDESLIYFSKLYSSMPKSPYTPNGLLTMGKVLKAKGQKEEAKQALSELLKNFPKHRRAKEARSLIKKI